MKGKKKERYEKKTNENEMKNQITYNLITKNIQKLQELQ